MTASEQDLLDAANAAADAAGEVLRKWFRNPPPVEIKDAVSPVVTEADREAEAVLRDVIRTRFPDHAIVGEELEAEAGTSGLTWVLDPIDGTIAFLAGKPTFVTLIGVFEGDRPVLGMIDQPVVGDRWLAAGSAATLHGGAACRTAATDLLENAVLSTTALECFARPDDRAWFEAMSGACRVATYGGDGYAYGLLASGHIDLVIESGLAWHDAAALVRVVENAGGCLTDFSGQPLRPGCASYEVLAAANSALRDAAITFRRDMFPGA